MAEVILRIKDDGDGGNVSLSWEFVKSAIPDESTTPAQHLALELMKNAAKLVK